MSGKDDSGEKSFLYQQRKANAKVPQVLRGCVCKRMRARACLWDTQKAKRLLMTEPWPNMALELRHILTRPHRAAFSSRRLRFRPSRQSKQSLVAPGVRGELLEGGRHIQERLEWSQVMHWAWTGTRDRHPHLNLSFCQPSFSLIHRDLETFWKIRLLHTHIQNQTAFILKSGTTEITVLTAITNYSQKK